MLNWNKYEYIAMKHFKYFKSNRTTSLRMSFEIWHSQGGENEDVLGCDAVQTEPRRLHNVTIYNNVVA
jgi:hypothetical protein